MKRWRRYTACLGWSYLYLSAGLVLVFLGGILLVVCYSGASVVDMEFIRSYPRLGMTAGGIFPAVVGTVWVTMVTALFAVPVGLAAGIYLGDRLRENRLNSLVRASIRNLAGVPSILYGLFGVAIFVRGMGAGASVLAAGLTLGLLTLPYIITTTEEALKQVPASMREGSLALGATDWETLARVVLPAAAPGILTGVLLGLSRAAGETTPILFTGAAFYLRYLPGSVFDEFMALPYHLFILSTQHHAIETVRPLAEGTALVLLGFVLLLHLLAVLVRYRYRRHHHF
jgi:phosphate transport system permease protein